MKWYQKPLGIIALLILFFPVGLFLMWKYSNWGNQAKWTITGAFAVAVVIMLLIPQSPPTGQESIPKVEPKKEATISAEEKAAKEAEEKRKAEEESKTVYTLSITAKAFGQDTLEVEGKTNLPDSAVLDIKVDRISIWVGEDVERFFTIAEVQTTVRGGSFITKVKVDDKKFLDFEKISGEIIKQLDPKVEITVVFDPKADNQDKQVVKIVGEGGEKLETSPQKDVFGSATPTPRNRLEVTIRTPLKFPYSDQLPK